MKILLTADWHFGLTRYSSIDKATNLPSRMLDYQSTINQIIDIAVSEKVGALINAGDIFHTAVPSPTQEVMMMQMISRLSKTGIKSYLITGNHDYNSLVGRKHATGVIKEANFDNVSVFDRPAVAKIDGSKFIFIPHCDSSELVDMPQCGSDCIVVCHTTFEGGKVGAEEYLLSKQAQALNIPEARIVLAGHLHKPQVIKREKYCIIYPGSIEICDFGERDEQKRVIIMDTDTLKWKSIPLTTRRFLQIDMNEGDTFPEADMENKIVKVRVICKSGRSTPHIDFPKGNYFLAGLEYIIEDEEEKVAEITEENSVKSAFAAYMKDKTIEHKERVEIEGNKIIDETCEGKI